MIVKSLQGASFAAFLLDINDADERNRMKRRT